MKYTVSGSILQYNVGLTLSFLSLISRGVGTIQKGNHSILYPYRFCHAGSERAIGEIERQVLKRTATLVVLSTFTRNKASKMEEIVIISSIST